jgi:protein phosphatase
MNDVALLLDSYGVSHTGCVRQHNEDAYLVEPRFGLWAVADGMGGHEAGEVASASIIDHLGTVGIASSAPDLRARFEDRLHKAHAEIRRIAEARGATIGSTVAALLVKERRFACVWSGDSRIYLIRGGSISQLSRDHTEAQELLDQGLITETEAQNWPRRNVITRAVGVGEEVALDYRQGEVAEGDVFILATDGLTAHVDEAEIEGGAGLASAQAICEELLARALERGGADNVTIIVVRARAEGEAAAGDSAV